MTDRNRPDPVTAADQDLSQTLTHSQPARPPDSAEVVPADLPAKVGRYVVEHELKQGGMGRIIRLWDDDFQRPLALKLVRDRDPRMERRLLYEGRLTGCLQHPGIPPVHDQGRLPDGRPYFILKLIQGASLSELLRRRTSAADDLPRFLLIFEQLCEAVGYAHSRGVIHRDLKPGNVMVGAFGEVQLIDWGLAKVVPARPEPEPPPAEEEPATAYGLKQTAAETGLETTAGTLLGTPAYMAPEQARGELDGLDARADVFGLGAILCEVLTGGPPYRGDRQAVYEMARRADLQEAWARLEGCAADRELVALTRHCLAADRAERPPDGAAVARAVAAYRQEVQQRLRAAEVAAAAAAARADEEVRRRQAERQRRRLAVGLAAAVVLLVLGGSAWRLGQVRQAAERRVRGAALNHEVRAAVAECEDKLQKLRERIDDPRRVPELLSELDKWRDELRLARLAWQHAEKLAAGGADLLGPEEAAGIRRLKQRLEWEESGHALAEQLDGVRLRAASLVEGKFDYLQAARDYPGVFAAAGLEVKPGQEAALAARIKASPARPALVAALDHWAVLGKQDDLAARLMGIARQADPDPWRNRFRDVRVRKESEKVEGLVRAVRVEEQPPQVLHALALLLPSEGGKRAAVLRRAVRHYLRDFWLYFALGADATDPVEQAGWCRAALAVRPGSEVALLNLSKALQDSRDREGAIAHLRTAIALNPQFALAHQNLGNALRESRDLQGSLKHCRIAVALNPKSARAHTNLASTLRECKDMAGAHEHLRTARQLAPEDPWVYVHLGLVCQADKDLKEAVRHFRKAIELDPRFARAHADLGLALQDSKDLDGAIKHFRTAIELDPKYAAAHNNLGRGLADRKEVEEAVKHFRIALELDPNFAVAHNNLGIYLRDIRKDLEGAIQHFRTAIALAPQYAHAHHNLGIALYHRKDLEGAAKYCRLAIALDPKVAGAHMSLGLALFESNDLPGAIKSLRTAVALDPHLAKAYLNLGSALRASKDLAGAVRYYGMALALDRKNATAHMNLGLTLRDAKDLAGAAKSLRTAIALDPQLGQAHGALGMVLLEQGQFAEARAATRLALKMLPPGDSLRKAVQPILRASEQLVPVEEKLNAYLEKGEVPGQPGDMLKVVELCRLFRHYHATAAKLYGLAFAAQPALAEDVQQGHRCLAAHSALLAAAGHGRDPGELPADARATLRAQALAWLRADLRQWLRRFQARDPKALSGLLTILPAWNQETAFADVRDAPKRAALPADERQAWASLWADVDQLLKEIAANIRTERFTGTLTAQDRERTHEVKLRAGQAYLIDLESTQFDASLRLHDERGQLLAKHDGAMPRVNRNARLSFTAPADGTYRLIATSGAQGGAGAYTLAVRSYGGPKVQDNPGGL